MASNKRVIPPVPWSRQRRRCGGQRVSSSPLSLVPIALCLTVTSIINVLRLNQPLFSYVDAFSPPSRRFNFHSNKFYTKRDVLDEFYTQSASEHMPSSRRFCELKSRRYALPRPPTGTSPNESSPSKSINSKTSDDLFFAQNLNGGSGSISDDIGSDSSGNPDSTANGSASFNGENSDQSASFFMDQSQKSRGSSKKNGGMDAYEAQMAAAISSPMKETASTDTSSNGGSSDHSVSFFMDQSQKSRGSSRKSGGMDAYEAQMAAAMSPSTEEASSTNEYSMQSQSSQSESEMQSTSPTDTNDQPFTQDSAMSGTGPTEMATTSAPTPTTVEASESANFETDTYGQSSSSAVSTTNPKPAAKSPTKTKPISNVDARVLESILNEGKLDLSTEAEVKKLLEGPRVKEEDAAAKGGGGSGGKGEYSSKFVSTISDNSFWNSLKAKASSIIDSVQIYIENRIERDAKLLASVGLFAWDRVQQDVARALPAAGRQVKRALLASNSSYAEKLVNATESTIVKRGLLLGDGEGGIYDELTTPADEIKQVTAAIRDILSGKELPPSSSYGSRRGTGGRGPKTLRSFAPAGTARLAERQRQAYQARKKTVLARETEGFDRKLGRAVTSVTDATWEFRREMQSDVGREAGYRSKEVRRVLADGAKRMLEASREGGKWLSGSRDNTASKMLGGDKKEAASAAAQSANVIDSKTVDVTASIQEAEIIEEVMEETKLEVAPDGLLSPQSFMEEKRRLVTSLDSCLSQPGQTWLTKEVVSKATLNGISLDGDMLREVITSMVTARDELKEEMSEEEEGRDYLTIAYVQSELRRMKQMIDSVTSSAVSAAGEEAAALLKQELEGFVLSDSLDEIIEIEIERVEQLLAELVAAREEEIIIEQTNSEVVKEFDRYADPVAATVVTDDPFDIPKVARRNRFTDADFTAVEAEPASYERTAEENGYSAGMPFSTDQEVDQQLKRSTVEVVSDQEFSDYEQRFKSAYSDVEDRDDENEKNDSPVGKFILRVIDAIFFVGEKFFLVGLPGIISTSSNILERYSQAQNRGSGSPGWKRLKNIKARKNQY